MRPVRRCIAILGLGYRDQDAQTDGGQRKTERQHADAHPVALRGRPERSDRLCEAPGVWSGGSQGRGHLWVRLPRLREHHHHGLNSGGLEYLAQLGAPYRGELFAAGEYWFRVRHDYAAALDAFEAARQLGLRSYESEMRVAGCLMRVGRRADAERMYRSLIAAYPSARGAKTSFIDSLLYANCYGDALRELKGYGFEPGDDEWVAREYARAYFGLHRYREAVAVLEVERSRWPKAAAYSMLAMGYHRLGQREKVGKVLDEGLELFPSDQRLLLRNASHLIQLGEQSQWQRAEAILEDLRSHKPNHGGVVHQLVKLLCRQGRIDDALRLAKATTGRLYPERYNVPVRVEVLMAQERWEEALAELRSIDEADEHLVGLKKKVYLKWARATADASRRDIAKTGLAVNVAKDLMGNMPILVTSARLAFLAGDDATFDSLIARVHDLNPDVAELLKAEESDADYWEDAVD